MKFKIRYCDRKDPKHPFKIFDVEANNEDEALKEFLQIHPEAGFWQVYPESDFYLLVDKIDSDRRTFETGAMRGSAEGKENYIGAVSWTALKRVTEYQNNAEKKGGYNKGHWKKGIPIEEYEKSLMRHLQKYFANKYEGASYETDVDHLAAAYFNLQGILHEEEKKNTSNN